MLTLQPGSVLRFKEVKLMAKGQNTKPEYVKTGENPPPKVATSDTLSDTDKGFDYIKTGERAQVVNQYKQ